MREKLKLTIKEVSYHRNGVSGEGFHAIHFIDHGQKGDGNKDAQFMAIVFDEPGQCACIQLNQPGEFTVRFGINSWRGDHYEPQMREAIKTEQSSGSIRAGPFAIPT